MLMGIMGHITDEDAYPIAQQLVSALPPGSYLTLADGTDVSDAFQMAQEGYNNSGGASRPSVLALWATALSPARRCGPRCQKDRRGGPQRQAGSGAGGHSAAGGARSAGVVKTRTPDAGH
jgi:hypothetical protein